ncbi:MAG: GNAT family N-acetyltransferase [Gammaproteobacteria bacterium]|nr:MAG: GNAT family N-acetyltransferase [Gammaproteobacteria bacterium]
MRNENYSISQIGPNEFDLLIPLMQNCFGISVDVNYFKWKYLDNPAGHFVGFVAISNETKEIGAYYGVIPELFFINGKEKIIYQSCDTMTHANHRKRGLFQMLALHCFEYLRERNELFIYGFGGAQSTPGFIKFGWSNLFNPVLSFFPRQLLFASILVKGSRSKEAVNVEDIHNIKDLILNSNRHAKIHSVKRIENYNWRISNPLRKYEVIALRDGAGSFSAFAVYYKENGKIFLFDWYGVNRQAEKKIINSVKHELRLDTSLKGIVSYIKPRDKRYKSLKRQMFLVNPFKFGPLVPDTTFITFSNNDFDFSNPSNWDPNAYEHDAF